MRNDLLLGSINWQIQCRRDLWSCSKWCYHLCALHVWNHGSHGKVSHVIILNPVCFPSECEPLRQGEPRLGLRNLFTFWKCAHVQRDPLRVFAVGNGKRLKQEFPGTAEGKQSWDNNISAAVSPRRSSLTAGWMRQRVGVVGLTGRRKGTILHLLVSVLLGRVNND